MSAIRDGRIPVELDKTRYVLMSLNVLDEMQDKFGGFDKLGEAMSGRDSLKNIRWLLTLMLNEGTAEGEPPLEEKQVGRLIHAGNIPLLKDIILGAMTMGAVGKEAQDGEEEDDEEQEKNKEGGKVKK